MTVEELVEQVQKLRVYRFKGQPALYQPIALLWAIGRASDDRPRLAPWTETEQELRDLLLRHGRHGERGRPDYPVAALHHAGIWEISGHHGAVPPAHGDAELRRWFADNQPASGLREPIHDLMQDSRLARTSVVDAIITSYFGEYGCQELLSDVHLSAHVRGSG